MITEPFRGVDVVLALGRISEVLSWIDGELAAIHGCIPLVLEQQSPSIGAASTSLQRIDGVQQAVWCLQCFIDPDRSASAETTPLPRNVSDFLKKGGRLDASKRDDVELF